MQSLSLSLSLSLSSWVIAVFAAAPPLAAQSWDAPRYWYGDSPGNLRAVHEIAHAGLIGKSGPNQGKVVLWRANKASKNGDLQLWDPAAPGSLASAFVPGDPLLNNLFCSGHSFDADGDLVVAGGDRDEQCSPIEPNWSYVFDPGLLTWTRQGDMLDEEPSPPPPGRERWGHYYPSTLVMHNGLVASIGGTSAPWNETACGPNPLSINGVRQNEWQHFYKGSGIWFGQSTNQALPGLPTTYRFGVYPLVHLLSSGHVFASTIRAGQTQPRLESPSAFINADVTPFPPTVAWTDKPSSTWLEVGGTNVNLRYPTGFLFPWTVGHALGTDRVVVIGGQDTHASYNTNPPGPLGSPALNQVWEIQSPTVTASAWSNPVGWGALHHARVYANAVLLPNLTVLVVGGSTNFFRPFQDVTGGEVLASPVYEPELLDLLNPSAGWVQQPPHVSPRLYHSVAVLLKDGRVLVMGGYRSNQNSPAVFPNHSDAEVFSPAYLDDGFQRPAIDLVSVPTLSYGGPDVTVHVSNVPGTEIEFATLIRCGSVTHHFDWDQRCVRLNVLEASEDSVTVTGLPSQASNGHFIAPPGWYLLHIVTSPVGPQGVRVPSVAKFIQVG